MTEEKAKGKLDENSIAKRAAMELKEGEYINLGFGIPTLVSSFIPKGVDIILQAETGLLNYGDIVTKKEEIDWRYMNASGQPVRPRPGLSLFNIEESFDMIRGKKMDVTMLGALQVSEKGDLANWRAPGLVSSIGGAMDLAAGAKKVIVCMTHVSPKNEFKIVKECTFPFTAKECVDLIITDIGVIEVTRNGLVLKEVAPDWTPEDVQALTEPKLTISPELREMKL